MKPLFISGATGFVGRTLLLRAVAEGTPVIAPVRDAAKFLAQLAEENIDPGLITPLSTNPDAWGDIRPDRAVLCAGVLFARSREEYFRTNVDWNLEVIRALPASCRTVVLSSQSAGGPTPSGQASRSETDQDAPITWYGESKLQLELSIRQNFSNRPLTILRPPMILGARDSATLPLFKMARGLVRPKPGLLPKFYSFLGVNDVIDAVLSAISLEGTSPHVASEELQPRGTGVSPVSGVDFRSDCRCPNGRDARSSCMKPSEMRPSLDMLGPFYIAGDTPISDLQLIASAARAAGGKGVTLPVPLAFVRMLALVVDAVPSMRLATPSLTRDRAREIWPDRWVVDASAFHRATGWRPNTSLDQALNEAFAWLHQKHLL